MNLLPWAVVLLAGVLGLWRVEVADSARALAVQAEQEAVARQNIAEDRIAEQAAMIIDQRKQVISLTAADVVFRQLSQAIDRDGTATRRTLQELKQNDQAVTEYLRGAVPVAYGMQFARPETTDPSQYKPGPGVSAGGVPPASPAAGAAQ